MIFPWDINRHKPKPKTVTPKVPKEKLPEPDYTHMTPRNLSLLPYQEEGVKFMCTHQHSLIADEMGLGKTVQAISFMNCLAQDYRKRCIVCPASVVINWQRELFKWESMHNVIGGIPLSTYITSYNQLLTNPHIYENTHFDILIVDEAHYIRNPKTQRGKAVAALARNAKRVVLLTGTPMPNARPIELWPLLQILDVHYWDPAGKKYTKREGGGYDSIDVGPGEGVGFFAYAKRFCAAKKVTIGKKSHWEFNGASNLDKLSTILKKSVMLRRTKEEVLPQLPEKRYQTITLQRFDEHVEPDMIMWDGRNYEEKLAALKKQKVRFDELARRRRVEAEQKANSVVEFVLETTGQDDKVVIFAHHLSVLQELHEQLAHQGAVMLTGDSSPEERQTAIDVFQDDPECRFFIGSLQAAGTGITLTAASRVVYAEIDWSPAMMDQSEDRLHRIGQKNSVLIQYVVVEDTIDANIARCLLEKKENLVKAGLKK